MVLFQPRQHPFGGAENARMEKARLEKAAPNCRGGKRETGKRGTKTAGVENSGKACMDSQMFLCPLLFKCSTYVVTGKICDISDF